VSIPILFRRGTALEGVTKNPILREGEGAFEIDTGLFRIGDGETHYVELPVFVTTDHVQSLVDAAMADAPGAAVDLYNHINSLSPHPVYDEGPSLALLYENKKV
jgi:Major tropism determinant N-terminal domain